MSKSALRDLNTPPLSESLRSNKGGKKNAMKVVSQAGSNDENDALKLNQLVTKRPNQSISSENKRLNRKPSRINCSSTPTTTAAPAPAQIDPLAVQNDAPAEPPGQEIEYVPSEELKALEGSENVLATLLERLDSKEWLTVWDALTHVRQLSIFSSSSMLPILNAVILLVIKAMKNPRSALCKTSIMASSDLFKAYADQMLDAFDPLLLQLLLKASQDKKFVCEEAERALIGMTTWISPNLLLQKLLPYATHRHPRVRAKAAICISNTVSKLGIREIMDFGIEQLIHIAASQLNDQLPEGREAARKLIMVLHAAYKQCYLSENHVETTDDVWEQLCVNKLSAMTAQAVLRVS
ncbi:hypothetical protein O6H91_03G125700 [Diphasiastrum complanatum]|uniref:Uncharacterized protein n=2 Tax=Diphasiastrum complanatum TaxID=34168 RepID=A0ACC2EBB3_DIPCM|nr:hypothetical protein O6H91_Y425800 [Diphasiastrum complanatum]KAJ7248111.1 hypothetical protein O6H91_Y425800 [Diphasiastrum complanatum]KAJ7277604.1 hypothetical protein O6H91_Y388400 [Diphasiastrum complanatum]KAJ7563786.1 hypothetical protein O6H91_03G125700 [Diphasiastrum complanatum]KAJ7563787.1 hypothetical protein O6H91_03G125700 [Diphasiastrum complanatum]